VVKSSLAPFDCTLRGGVRTMDAEPSILCNGKDRHGRMSIVAVFTLVVFALGVPAALTAFLATNLDRVRFDQRLREKGEGDSALTNPNVQVCMCMCMSMCMCMFVYECMCKRAAQPSTPRASICWLSG
jgi:hypothetical protein